MRRSLLLPMRRRYCEITEFMVGSETCISCPAELIVRELHMYEYSTRIWLGFLIPLLPLGPVSLHVITNPRRDCEGD